MKKYTDLNRKYEVINRLIPTKTTLSNISLTPVQILTKPGKTSISLTTCTKQLVYFQAIKT